ncbi:MAG: 3-methyl-2-oxobutanoate hydroxymethyltransferase, partial [uncultured Nocardioides sp.]
ERRDGAVRLRPRVRHDRRPRQAGPDPPPAGDEGARREDHHAHGVRHVHRRHLRRGRHRAAAGGRLRVQQRAGQRDLPPDHRRRAPPPDPGRRPVREARDGRRRPPVRLLPGEPGAGLPHRRALHEGGRRPLRQARGRCRDGAGDREVHPRRHPRDGTHRLHPAERAHAGRLPRPGTRRHGRAGPPRRSGRPGRRGVRRGDGDGARRRRGPGDRRAVHPDHRHRGRERLRRPGARLAGRVRPPHRPDGALRQAVRRRPRRAPGRGSRLRRRRAGRHVPGARAHVL